MSVLFDFGLDASEAPDQRIEGVALATVINNLDLLGEGRVQVALPWLPGVEPWARVSTLAAGMMRGTYFIPQIGDEVLVAFNQGDIHEPFILGCLWSTLGRPPAVLPTDPVTKSAIQTRTGQKIEFDDKLGTVTVSNTTRMSVELGPVNATISAGLTSITLDPLGNVTITALKSLTLQSNTININGGKVSINSTGATTMTSGGTCSIKGTTVMIN